VELGVLASGDCFGLGGAGLGLGCCAIVTDVTDVTDASTNQLRAIDAKIDVVLLFIAIL
jgi:hypothetical protein